MSPELILIRMELEGAAGVATEAGIASDAIRGTGAASEEAGAASALASSRVGKASSAMGTFSKMAKLAKGAAFGLGAGIAAFALEAKAAVSATMDLAKVTMGLHRNLGLTTQTASEWGSVAQARGVDTTALGVSFKSLSTHLSDLAHGSTSAADSFKLIGLQAKDFKGLNFNQSILEVADAFGKAKGGADRMAAAGKLLGKGYAAILPLFSDGSESLKQQLTWAKRYGAVLHGNVMDQMSQFREEQIKMQLAWQGIQIQIGQKIIPILNKVIPTISHFIRQLINGRGAGGQFADFLSQQLFPALKDIWTGLGKVAHFVGDVAHFLGPVLMPVVHGAVDVFHFFSRLLSGDFSGALSAVGDLLGHFVDWMKAIFGPPVKAALSALKGAFQGIKAAIQFVINKVHELLDLIPNLLDALNPLGNQIDDAQAAAPAMQAIMNAMQIAQGGVTATAPTKGTRSRTTGATRTPRLQPLVVPGATEKSGRAEVPYQIRLERRVIAEGVAAAGESANARR